MMKTKLLILVLVFVLVLTVASVVLASNGVALRRWVLSGGASQSTGGEVSINATLGQPIVGVISDGNMALEQGFWHEVYRGYIYLPIIQR